MIWGAGKDAVKLSRLFKLYGNIYNDNIVGVVDSNMHKCGELLFGKKIFSPTGIFDVAWDKIVIASTLYDKEIKENLVSNYGVDVTDVISYKEYCHQKVIHYQYEKNLKRNNDHHVDCNSGSFDLNSIVVYTAILGDYDVLRDPLVVEPNVHYVCYTDQKNIKSDIWEIRNIQDVPPNDRAVYVRKYKMLPHELFPEYKTSVWIDASIQILGKLTELIKKYQRHSNFLLMPHNERICAYEEAFANVVGLLNEKKIVVEQIKKYLQEGYPIDSGLMVGGFLVRNHHEEKIKKTMKDWFCEISCYSKRDQISLPYVIWKNKLAYDLCDLNIFDNPWMRRISHKHLIDSRGSDK